VHRAFRCLWRGESRGTLLASLVLCGYTLALTASEPALAATITPVTRDDAGASALATAMVADPSTLAGAHFVTVPPFGTPNAVADSLSFFPTNGSGFAILSTGDARLADTPNTSGSSGANDGGPTPAGRGNTAFDVTTLALNLDVPAGRNCVQFDFAFYSEEFPEWVGTAYNDAFITELDSSTWTTSNSSISAPDNFAFDAKGNPVTINSTGLGGMNELNASNTTYDGATVLLQAAHQITPGSHTLYFSIFDQGDHIYDSAVLLDNLRLLTTDPAKCQPGAKQSTLPLIFLPGITGSYLRSDSGEAWPRAFDMLTSPSDSFLDNLQLADDGVSPKNADDHISVWTDHGKQGIIDEIDLGCVFGHCAYRIQPYTATFDFLESHGYQENVNLFPFAFDWRKSADFNANALIAKIDEVLAQTGAPRVNILAHSQGGLVTEAALANPLSAGKVARVMTMGTPYLGATKALGVLDYGQPCQTEVLGICILDTGEVQKLVTNAPGFLELLPSREFYGQAYIGPVFTLFDRNGDGIEDDFIDFGTERAKLADRNLALIDQATAFHDRVDFWSPADPSVQLTRLVGSGVPTIQTIIEFLEEECSGILWWHECHLAEKSQFAYGNGDGTVPLHSADLFDPNRGFDERGGAPDAYAPGVSHGDLVKQDDPLAYAVADFAGASTFGPTGAAKPAAPAGGGPTGPTPELADQAAAEAAARSAPRPDAPAKAAAAFAGITDTPSPLAGTEVLVKGSVTGLITDAAGNRLGMPDATSGVELDEIPGAVFNRASGSGSSFVTLDGTYQGSWTATADGEVQFVVRDYADDVIGVVATTVPISVHAGAVLSLGFSRPGDLSLLVVGVDDNGDGTVDRTVSFGAPVTGGASSDLTPPVSKVNVQNFIDSTGRRMANVTMTAADNAGGSGVDRIEYALDATDVSGVYTSMLTVPVDGNIIVRAIDRAGNVEAPYQVVRLALDAEPNAAADVTSFLTPHVNTFGYLDYAGDVDWWGFDLPVAGRYQFQLIGLPLDYDLALYDAGGTLLNVSENRGTMSEKIVMEMPAGRAYLRATGFNGAFDPNVYYRINVTPLG
jgi:hypothetical protein